MSATELRYIKRTSVATCPDCGHPLWVRGFNQKEGKALYLWCPRCGKRGVSKITLSNSRFEREALRKLA